MAKTCAWRGVGGTVRGITYDGERVTMSPIGQIEEEDLTSRMDPTKAFNGTVQSARARDFA